MKRKLLGSAVLFASLAGTPGLRAATYDVGPGQALAALGEVPWESLQPGDTVLLHWRPQPYREKWVIGRQGSPGLPITVRGLPGPNGERPVVSGDGATTRQALDYWNEDRGVIKIGGSSIPPDTTPEWIVVEGLEIRSAHESYGFTDDRDNGAVYSRNAAALYVEKGRNLIIRDCILHDSGNGLFIGSPADDPTTEVLVEGNWIHGNGNVGSIFEHNSYTEALGITFQANHYGPLRPGADGNNLKDRSAGLVVRYNWIESGNRQLDLVDTSLGSVIHQDPRYGATHVYGNVLIETEGAGNRQVVHYGGDSGNTDRYRKGTLHFYNNTVVSERTDRTTLFRLSSGEEHCDARNNIVWLPEADGSTLELLNDDGRLTWTHDWLEPGWFFSFFGTNGVLDDRGTTVEGTEPGFVDAPNRDFTLRGDADCLDAGTDLLPEVLPLHDVLEMPVALLGSAPRPASGPLDIGAFEWASVTPPPGEATQLRVDGDALSWQAAPDATTHDLLRGDILALRTAGLSGAVLDCTADGLAGTTFIDARPPPPPSLAAWYLVRGENASGSGTWGSAARDVGLAGAPNACP